MTAPTFNERAAVVEDLLASQPLIRAINFHATPRSRAAEYERQLEHCSRHFSSVTEDDLDAYLATGRWHKPKPGMIIALYEGYRGHYDVIVPLLERYGLIGWFFVITEFVKAPVADQAAYGEKHDITIIPREYADGRYALSWEELRQLSRAHVIASHARNHVDLTSLSPSALEGEILGSQRDFEQYLGRPVRSFVSYSGPPYGEHAPGDRLIDTAGYQFVFSNFKIQRLRAWSR